MWTNPAVERCRAELALNVAVKVFDRHTGRDAP